MSDLRPVTWKAPAELVEWLDFYALERKSSRSALLQAAVEGFRRDCEGGVPDLPAGITSAPGITAPGITGATRFRGDDWALERQRKLNKAKGL